MKSSLSVEVQRPQKMVSNVTEFLMWIKMCVTRRCTLAAIFLRDRNSLCYRYVKVSRLYSAWEMTFTQYFIIWNLAIQGNLRLWKRGGFDYIQELLKLLLHLQKKVGQAENGKCHFSFWMQENNAWNTPKILKKLTVPNLTFSPKIGFFNPFWN